MLGFLAKRTPFRVGTLILVALYLIVFGAFLSGAAIWFLGVKGEMALTEFFERYGFWIYWAPMVTCLVLRVPAAMAMYNDRREVDSAGTEFDG